MQVRNYGSNEHEEASEMRREVEKQLPKPTTAFRRRAWIEFQRAIDPSAPPKPLKLGRR